VAPAEEDKVGVRKEGKRRSMTKIQWHCFEAMDGYQPFEELPL
jgi:hypothetical protein